MESIKVEGYDLDYDYNKIKNQVVKIGLKFYFKHDNNRVIAIKNSLGKLRYFRMDSPLLCVDEITRERKLKSDCFLTEDGIFLDKKSQHVVAIGSKYHRRSYCVQIDGQWYLKTDTEIIYDCGANRYFLMKDCIHLSDKYYKKPFTHKDVKTVVDINGDVIKKVDSYSIFNIKKDVFEIYYTGLIRREQLASVYYDFQDKTNPQEDRLEAVSVKQADFELGLKEGTIVQFILTSTIAPIFIPKSRLEYFTNCREVYIMPRLLSKIEEVRKSINANYSDLDDYENKAKMFKVITKPFAGKQNIYKPNSFGIPRKSKTFTQLGGLQYSFGIEFETSQGLIQAVEDQEKLGLQAVGDRSIGAGEYVTSPMMGDGGVNTLKEICEILNKQTLVDDRCGLHVHIGSLFTPENRNNKPTSRQAPSFSKQFLINSVNLGAYLEEELYSSLPKNRQPTLYHCHSIRRFAPCTEENFDVNFGAYIFGPKEWWLTPTENCPERLFNFEDYKLNKERNSKKSLGTWANGRYKWLNLIPSYTSGPHRTIEFRIFSGTTSFEKTYAYLLTSMAFTYVADNKTSSIKPGITLSQVFQLTWPRNPEIVMFLDSFYDARKKKFNRKDIYGGLNFKFLNY